MAKPFFQILLLGIIMFLINQRDQGIEKYGRTHAAELIIHDKIIVEHKEAQLLASICTSIMEKRVSPVILMGILLLILSIP